MRAGPEQLPILSSGIGPDRRDASPITLEFRREEQMHVAPLLEHVPAQIGLVKTLHDDDARLPCADR